MHRYPETRYAENLYPKTRNAENLYPEIRNAENLYDGLILKLPQKTSASVRIERLSSRSAHTSSWSSSFENQSSFAHLGHLGDFVQMISLAVDLGTFSENIALRIIFFSAYRP